MLKYTSLLNSFQLKRERKKLLMSTKKKSLSFECADLQCWAELYPKSPLLPVTVTPVERNSLCPVGETCSPLSGFSRSLSFGDHNVVCTQLENKA